MPGECLPHQGENFGAPRGWDRAGKRHVKSEGVEYERVAPAVEIGDLGRIEPGRQPPFAFFACEGSAEAVELLGASGGELVERVAGRRAITAMYAPSVRTQGAMTGIVFCAATKVANSCIRSDSANGESRRNGALSVAWNP